MTEILNPNHKQWPTFRLKLKEVLTTYVNDKPHSKCQGDFNQTIKILKSMPGIDTDETILLYKEYQAYCDCSVLINLARNFNNKGRDHGTKK